MSLRYCKIGERKIDVKRYEFYFDGHSTCYVDVDANSAYITRTRSCPDYEYPFLHRDEVTRERFDMFLETRALPSWGQSRPDVLQRYGMSEYSEEEYLDKTCGRTPLDKISLRYVGEINDKR